MASRKRETYQIEQGITIYSKTYWW